MNDNPSFESAAAAVHRGDVDSVRRLLARHPELATLASGDGDTLLQRASASLLVDDYSRAPQLLPDAETERVEIARLLLAAGADTGVVDEYDWTPLHSAAYAGATSFCRALIAGGADASAVGWEGGRPVDVALAWGHSDAATVIADADPTPSNLRTAAGIGDVVRLAELLGDGRELHHDAGAHRTFYRAHDGLPEWTPGSARQEVLDEALTYACRAGLVAPLAPLVAAGADVDAAVYLGTGLTWAASIGSLEVVDWLLARGADVNRVSDFGGRSSVTPLHIAAWNEHPLVVDRLIERGADLVAHDAEFHSTPLGWALYRESPEIVDRLLDVGCERHLHYAAAGGRVDAARALLTADPSCVDEDHGVRTALHVAASRGDVHMCGLLLQYKADVSRTDESGKTALEIAVAAGHEAAARVLRAAGGRSAG